MDVGGFILLMIVIFVVYAIALLSDYNKNWNKENDHGEI